MSFTKLFVAVAATTLTFASPTVPAAFAGNNDRQELRWNNSDRDGRDRSRDDDRRERRSEPRYAVTFHLDGGSTRHKAQDRFRAAEIEDELSRLGVDVHIHDRRELHLSLRGERRTILRSDEDARLLARRLENYGFHVAVDRC